VVIEETPGDEQYEGRLSFFDVRGVVNRPLNLHVEHQDLDGNRRITIFDRGTARLVAREIDRRWTRPAKARRRHGHGAVAVVRRSY
jgi:peptide deformylase